MKTGKRKVTDSYFDLVRGFPLRKIRSGAEHTEAKGIVRRLMLKGDEKLDAGECDYLETLARLVGDYEAARYLSGANRPLPLEILQHLMEERGMKPKDLGSLIGVSAASMVLNGHQEMSKDHIRKLASHFGVSPAVLM